MGFCENAVKAAAPAADSTADNEESVDDSNVDPYDVPEPLLGPKPDSIADDTDDANNNGDDGNDVDQVEYQDYDPQRCTVNMKPGRLAFGYCGCLLT